MRIPSNTTILPINRDREQSSATRARSAVSSNPLSPHSPAPTQANEQNRAGLAPDEIELIEAVRAIKQKYEPSKETTLDDLDLGNTPELAVEFHARPQTDPNQNPPPRALRQFKDVEAMADYSPLLQDAQSLDLYA